MTLTLSETVLCPARHVSEMPHAACACGLSPDGLSRPVVCSKKLCCYHVTAEHFCGLQVSCAEHAELQGIVVQSQRILRPL